MPPKTRKIGLSSSKEAPKKLEAHMKNTNYHVGLRYTKGQSGERHEGSLLYLRKDGTKESSDGKLDLIQLSVR